jgi:hypothetical protein
MRSWGSANYLQQFCRFAPDRIQKEPLNGSSSFWLLLVFMVLSFNVKCLVVLSWVSGVEAVVGRHKLTKEEMSSRQQHNGGLECRSQILWKTLCKINIVKSA